jgi:SNF2 family DNA or RNA helicase
VHTARFIMNGSLEEKMLNLRGKKQSPADQSMSKKMLDKTEAVRRKLEELQSLFQVGSLVWKGYLATI